MSRCDSKQAGGGRVPGVVPGFLDPPPYGHMYGTLHTHFPKIFFAKFWAGILWPELIEVRCVTNL